MFDLTPLKFEKIDFLLLIIGVVFYIFFRITKKIIIKKAKQGYDSFLLKILNIIRIFFWLVFTLYFFVFILAPSPFLGLVLFGIIIFGMWNTMKDLFAGMVIGVEGHFNKGAKVILPDGTEGEIEKLRLLNADIKLNNGKVLIYRYHQLIKEPIIKPNPTDNTHSLDLVLETTLQSKNLSHELNDFILNLPWVSHTFPPIINISKTEDGINRIEIKVNSSSEIYFKNIQEAITRELKR